jgi:hypothetical protein
MMCTSLAALTVGASVCVGRNRNCVATGVNGTGAGAGGSIESTLLSDEKCERERSNTGGEPSSDGELNVLGSSGKDRSSSSGARDRRLSVRKPNTCDARCGVLGSNTAYGLLCDGRGGVSAKSLRSLSSTSRDEMAGFSCMLEEKSCSVANELSGLDWRGVWGKWESVSGVPRPREEVDDIMLAVSLKDNLI